MAGGNDDAFDDEAIEEMARMFEQMGMPVDIKMLRSMVEQVRAQFEEMGIDPEKMSMSEVKFGLNSDQDEFMKNMESMLSGPQGLGEFLKMMGVDIHIKLIFSNTDSLKYLFIINEMFIRYIFLGLTVVSHRIVIFDHPFI